MEKSLPKKVEKTEIISKYPVDVLNQQYVKIECKPNTAKSRATHKRLIDGEWYPYTYHLEQGEKSYDQFASINGVKFTIKAGKRVWLPIKIIDNLDTKKMSEKGSGDDMNIKHYGEEERKFFQRQY